MAGRLRGYLAGNTAKPLLYELPEAPACAVAGKHGKVMYVCLHSYVP